MLVRDLVEDLGRFSEGSSSDFEAPAPECIFLFAVLSGTERDPYGLFFNPEVFEMEILWPAIPAEFLDPEPPEDPKELAQRIKDIIQFRVTDPLSKPRYSSTIASEYLKLERMKSLLTDEGPMGIAFRLIRKACQELWTLIVSEKIPRICEHHEIIYLNVCPRCYIPEERIRPRVYRTEKMPSAYHDAIKVMEKPKLCASRLGRLFRLEAKSLSSVFLAFLVTERIYNVEDGAGYRLLEKAWGYKPTFLGVDPYFYFSFERYLAEVLLEIFKKGEDSSNFLEYAARHPNYSGHMEPLSYLEFLRHIKDNETIYHKPISPEKFTEILLLALIATADYTLRNLSVQFLLEAFNRHVWPLFRRAGKYYDAYLEHASESFSIKQGYVNLFISGSSFSLSFGNDYHFNGKLKEILLMYHASEQPFDPRVSNSEYGIWPKDRRIQFRGVTLFFSKDRQEDLESALDLVLKFRETAGFDLFLRRKDKDDV